MARKVSKLEDGRDLYAYDCPGLECRAEGKDLSDREIQMIATTEALDREGEIVSINGWDTKNYKKNPVILEAHNYYMPAIGRSKEILIQDGKMVLTIEFPEPGAYDRSDIYRKLYKSGFMRAGSIGFLPIKWEYGDGKTTEYWRKFIEQEMLEYSLVTVPANPEAIIEGGKGFMKAMKEGIITGAELDNLVKGIYKAIDQELKSGGVFIPSKIETPFKTKDGDPNDEEPTDPPSDPKAGEGEKPKEEPGAGGGAGAGTNDNEEQPSTPAPEVTDDKILAMVKIALKQLQDEAIKRGVQPEAVQHYTTLLLGGEPIEADSTAGKRVEVSDAEIKKAVKDGLTSAANTKERR